MNVRPDRGKFQKPLLDVGARAEMGRAARVTVPRLSHGDWAGPSDGRDPVAILEGQGTSRVQDLLPIRYGRMLSSPFAFYRGAAALMARDLADTNDSGFVVQACGDAHAANFGIFGTPERDLVFDLNDFDETQPGPWEWDVKRLATSLVIAARHRNFAARESHDIVAGVLLSYRTALRNFATMSNLEIWYSRLNTAATEQWVAQLSKKQLAKAQAGTAKARSKDSLRALRRLTETVDGKLRFASQPPLLVPIRELAEPEERALVPAIEELVRRYSQTLRPELRHLLDRYRVVDVARKVVGVGSVGTRAWIVLLEGRDAEDPIVLQAKEAQSSVLEAYVGESDYPNHGERVVVGQRLMQSASDMLLGWLRTTGIDGVERDFYVRQLWDWKGSLDLDLILAGGMRIYGEMCGWTLARAHARSGDAVAIGAYLGSGDQFDRAIERFALAYADQNDKDHAALAAAVKAGRVTATTGV